MNAEISETMGARLSALFGVQIPELLTLGNYGS